MGASLGSHDTGDDYQLGYMVTHMRCLRIENMQLRIPSCAVTLDSLTVLLTHVFFCLPSMSPSLSVSRIRSSKGRFGPAYSVVNHGWGLISRSQKDIRRDNSLTLPTWAPIRNFSVGLCQGVDI